MYKNTQHESILELGASDMLVFHKPEEKTTSIITVQQAISAPSIDKQISSALEKLTNDLAHEKMKTITSDIINDLKNILNKLEKL